MADLSVTLFGHRLRNPLMNASGTLGYGVEIESLWGVETLGAYVTKGLSLKPHHGNPTPRVWEERGGMINSIGLQNVGVTQFFDRYFPLFKKKNTPVVVNFFGFTLDEYVECARSIRLDPLIVALEMNLSCPNIKKGGISFGKEPDTVYQIVREVKAVTEIPVVAKLSPEVKSIQEIAVAACEAGADGLTLINTLPGAVVDTKERRVPIRGGFSGPTLRPVALKAVCEVAKVVSVPIIGVGGIMNATDAIAFIMAGARAIQIGTATFVDPYAIPRIVKDLGELLGNENCPSVEHLIGVVS
jgi:dihydroorotate dehydrogenase (NAD+) catalytic subunit